LHFFKLVLKSQSEDSEQLCESLLLLSTLSLLESLLQSMARCVCVAVLLCSFTIFALFVLCCLDIMDPSFCLNSRIYSAVVILIVVLIYAPILSSVAAPLNSATKIRYKRGDPNAYDLPHFIQCPTGQGLYRLRSAHRNDYEDRYFDYACRVVTADPVTCTWTGYVNAFDEPISFMCPKNQYLAGVQSYHRNGYEDRRFSFQCCASSQLKSQECFLTGFWNNYDQYIDYTAPIGWIFAGTASVHSNPHE